MDKKGLTVDVFFSFQEVFCLVNGIIHITFSRGMKKHLNLSATVISSYSYVFLPLNI